MDPKLKITLSRCSGDNTAMDDLILESVERQLVLELLGLVEIYDIAKVSSKRWTKSISWALGLRNMETENGTPVPFTPRELLAVCIASMYSSDTSLFEAINRLRESSNEKFKDLYRRLNDLEVSRVSGPDRKGLFLLLAKLSEDNRIF